MMSPYRSRSTKPTALLWLVVVVADVAVWLSSAGAGAVPYVVAGLGVAGVAGVGLRTGMRGRITHRI